MKYLRPEQKHAGKSDTVEAGRTLPSSFRRDLSIQEGQILDIPLHRQWRWGSRLRLLPDSQVLQNLADDRRLLDEGDDLHGVPAFGTEQRIHLVDLPDQL